MRALALLVHRFAAKRALALHLYLDVPLAARSFGSAASIRSLIGSIQAPVASHNAGCTPGAMANIVFVVDCPECNRHFRNAVADDARGQLCQHAGSTGHFVAPADVFDDRIWEWACQQPLRREERPAPAAAAPGPPVAVQQPRRQDHERPAPALAAPGPPVQPGHPVQPGPPALAAPGPPAQPDPHAGLPARPAAGAPTGGRRVPRTPPDEVNDERVLRQIQQDLGIVRIQLGEILTMVRDMHLHGPADPHPWSRSTGPRGGAAAHEAARGAIENARGLADPSPVHRGPVRLLTFPSSRGPADPHPAHRRHHHPPSSPHPPSSRSRLSARGSRQQQALSSSRSRTYSRSRSRSRGRPRGHHQR